MRLNEHTVSALQLREAKTTEDTGISDSNSHGFWENMCQREVKSQPVLSERENCYTRLMLFSSMWEKGATKTSAVEKVSAGAHLRHQIIQPEDTQAREDQALSALPLTNRSALSL